MAIIFATTLVCLVACFALTQLRNINFRATAYLFTTAISFLVLLSMLPAAADEQPLARRVKWLSLYSLVVALVSLTAIVFAALFGRGFVDGRILAPASFLLVLPGLVWGILPWYLGRVFPGPWIGQNALAGNNSGRFNHSGRLWDVIGSCVTYSRFSSIFA